jgi:hypothetical protein
MHNHFNHLMCSWYFLYLFSDDNGFAMATTADHKNVRPYTIVEARSSAAKLMR